MTPQLLHDYGPTLISIVVGIVVGIYSRLGAKRAKVAVQQGDAAAVDMSHATLELGNLRAEVAELQEKVGKGRHAPAPAPVPDPIPDPVPVAPRPAAPAPLPRQDPAPPARPEPDVSTRALWTALGA
jgi:cell division septation protein DedD